MEQRYFWIALVGLLIGTACSKNEDQPTATSAAPTSASGSTQSATATADAQGVWTGAVTSSVGTIPITLLLSQSGTAVSGNIQSARASGTFQGTLSGNQLSFTIAPTGAPAPCATSAGGSATINGNSMTAQLSGSGVAISTPTVVCATTLSGQASLTRTTSSTSILLRP